MREILFRGKRTDNDQWMQGSLFAEGSRVEIIRGTCNNVGIEGVEVIPETVGQFTGLTDKNGKKIFEGDIIKAMMDYGPAGFYERIVPIEWLNDVGYQWQYFDISTIEVIGNIHDNPELLGDEQWIFMIAQNVNTLYLARVESKYFTRFHKHLAQNLRR